MTGDEIDFGHHWVLINGQRARLSWQRSTETLYLHTPAGDHLLLAADEVSVRNLLEGWENSGGSISWLAERMALAGESWRL